MTDSFIEVEPSVANNRVKVKTELLGDIEIPAYVQTDGAGVLISDANALPVKLTEGSLAIAGSEVTGTSSYRQFGANPAVGASSTEDIIFNGVISFPQAAVAMRIKSGGNLNDTAAGTGARKIVIIGLDENWQEAQEEIITAGTSASTATTTTFIRVFGGYVSDVGTYTGSNTANITVETTGGVIQIVIEAEIGQTQSSLYTVPAGKTAYITRVGGTIDSGKAATMRMWQRQNADDVTNPVTGKRMVVIIPNTIGTFDRRFVAYEAIPEKSDLWWTATNGLGASPSIGVHYDLILTTN